MLRVFADHEYIKVYGAPQCFSAMSSNLKGNTFCDFKFAPLDDIYMYIATVELQWLEHL